MNRSLLTVAMSAVALAVLTASAAARPPAGDWTFLRKDDLPATTPARSPTAPRRAPGGCARHKASSTAATTRASTEIGIYAALARGGNRAIVASGSTTTGAAPTIRMTLRGARNDDRLWVQGSYCGPSQPWSDSKRVDALGCCA